MEHAYFPHGRVLVKSIQFLDIHLNISQQRVFSQLKNPQYDLQRQLGVKKVNKCLTAKMIRLQSEYCSIYYFIEET